MIDALLDGASWALLLGGGFLCVVSGIGLHRMPDVFTRMHGASVLDTGGAALVLVGLALQAPSFIVALKLGLILLFILFTGPTASHALAQAAMARGHGPKRGMAREADPPGPEAT